ncbi:MAG: type I methionyl aminopeptidase [Spirochaetaceae bacterium]|jgi:methionyl aminopeptidase|nr:type I methionyl aminopeptidase [Spirochaetaceae bacterium]
MIRLKNEKQIDGIRQSCKALAQMYREMEPLVQVGTETIELDRWAQAWIKKIGGTPAFMGYGDKDNPFPGALCISVNEEVIHGIPSRRKIKEGDLVSIDSGINLGGYISDKSMTFEAGKVSPEAAKLNAVTKECLARGIAAAVAGQRLLQIARAVQGYAKEFGYGIVSSYCGHGVGLDVHEDPQVPNTPKGPNPKMMRGMVLAIEPMINLGTGDVDLLDDGWTVITADRKLSAHWENTVAIFADHTEVLTV